MADKSNYADKTNDAGSAPPEHRLNFGNDNRGFTPTTSETDRQGTFGKLAGDSLTGDWSWKPYRDRMATLFGLFRTFHGVPAGGAELSHSAVGTNVCGSAQNQRSTPAC